MAKLPVIKRVLREDIPNAPDWIGKLLYPVNLFFEQVFNALDKNLTLSENIQSQIKTVSFTTSSAYDGTEANFDTVSFSLDLPVKPQGLFIMQMLVDADNFTAIETAPFVNWLEINGTVNIYLVTGLSASTSYNMTVLLV